MVTDDAELLPPPLSSPPLLTLPPLPLSSSPFSQCSELDLSITLSPALKIHHTHLKPRPLETTQQSDQSQPKPCLQGQTGRKVRYKEPVVVTVTPEPHITVNRGTPPEQPIRGQRRSRGRHHEFSEKQVEPSPALSNPNPGCLERAELNTTLALKAELQSLQGAEFNTRRVVQETIQRSERTKNLINTRATEEVNVSRSQVLFSSLVSVDVLEDQLISQVYQERLPLALTHDNKAQDVPSLFPLMRSLLLRQKPLPMEEGPISDTLRPQRHPTCSTFDLYRRRSRCEATP
nr:protein phosphatase 1 regulatory subunit 35-like [Labrus bergylta]